MKSYFLDASELLDVARPPAPAVRVSWHESNDGSLPAVRAEWESCLARSPLSQQFFSDEWINAWLQSIAAASDSAGWQRNCRVLVARDGGAVVGILPLVLRKQFGCNWWSLAGYYQPERGFIYCQGAESNVGRAFAEALLARQGARDFLRFGPIDESQPGNAALLRTLCAHTSRTLVFDVGAKIVITDVPRTAKEYQEVLRSNAAIKRKKVHKCEQRMQREGKVDIRHYCNPRGDELRHMLADCRTVETASWLVGAGCHLRFASDNAIAFWERLCATSLCPRNQLNVWIIYFNDAPVAYRFTITAGGVNYVIANQYVEAFGKYSLGWVLHLRDLEDGVRRGATSIDMGVSFVDYKMRWGGREQGKLVEAFVFPSGPIGAAAAWCARFPALNNRLRSEVLGTA